jgi:flavin-dependent thymidylate synthase
MKLASEAPKVTLTKTFTTPFNNAVATARTCYSSKIITDADVARNTQQRDRIARSVYLAGHHTTLQHASFQFAIENLSRQAIWGFFHAHPFYNSEQVSQRYVEVKAGRVLIPDLDEDLQRRYTAAVERQMATYQRLLDELRPAVEAVYFGVFPGRRGPDGHGKTKAYTRAITKKCQEMARYVLPVATHAHLYHTVSGLTLHRYHRAAHALDTPSEQRLVIDAMIEEVKKVDPDFFDAIEDTLPLEDTHEAKVLASLSENKPNDPERVLKFRQEFENKLDGQPWSKLISYTSGADRVLGDVVREVFGLCEDELDDARAVALLLDPADNAYLGESLNLGTLSKAMRALELPQFTFKKCISHTADSQAQRHRTTPGVRPALTRHIVPGLPDYVTPEIFEHELAEVALKSYRDEMDATWDDIKALAGAGVTPEAWQYLLPNAVKVRFTETGSLLNQHHKWTTRLCYNAQEEIWKATVDEVNQVREVAPTLGEHLLPPCGLRARAKAKPVCPERDRFCGVTVWRKPRAEWLRVL